MVVKYDVKVSCVSDGMPDLLERLKVVTSSRILVGVPAETADNRAERAPTFNNPIVDDFAKTVRQRRTEEDNQKLKPSTRKKRVSKPRQSDIDYYTQFQTELAQMRNDNVIVEQIRNNITIEDKPKFISGNTYDSYAPSRSFHQGIWYDTGDLVPSPDWYNPLTDSPGAPVSDVIANARELYADDQWEKSQHQLDRYDIINTNKFDKHMKKLNRLYQAGIVGKFK